LPFLPLQITVYIYMNATNLLLHLSYLVCIFHMVFIDEILLMPKNALFFLKNCKNKIAQKRLRQTVKGFAPRPTIYCLQWLRPPHPDPVNPFPPLRTPVYANDDKQYLPYKHQIHQ